LNNNITKCYIIVYIPHNYSPTVTPCELTGSRHGASTGGPRHRGECQGGDMERRPEDRAVEEGVKEVLALSQAHRPKNTRRCYLPKQRSGRRVCFLQLFFCSIILFRSIANLFTGLVQNDLSPWWGVPALHTTRASFCFSSRPKWQSGRRARAAANLT